jgi:hypothetical protein
MSKQDKRQIEKDAKKACEGGGNSVGWLDS